MSYKFQGENELRTLYEQSGMGNLSYAIIRPGGLTDDVAVGPSKMELNQGDTIAGEVTRQDVAQCAVAAALSRKLPPNVVFELYQADRRAPLQGTFKEKSGFERRGDTYDDMFSGLKSGNIVI